MELECYSCGLWEGKLRENGKNPQILVILALGNNASIGTKRGD
jgi:hypothetical protein